MRRLHYGWAVVAALAITETTSWGVLYYGFTVFLRPIEDDLGWSRGQMATAFSIALLAQGVAGVFVGRWLDRRSPRVLMTCGSIAATALVLLWSRVQSLSAFYALWAVTGVVMSTILYEPAFTVVTKWFVEGRRAALTAVTLVAGFASTIFLPLENALIERYGWRQALVVLAVILGAITIPLHALVLRPAPLSPTRSPTEESDAPAADAPATPEHTTAEALRLPAFWFLAVAFVASSFTASALALHQIPYLRELGYSAAFAATATGLLGAMQVPGRILFAPLLRFLPRPVVTTLVFGAFTTGTLILAVGGGEPVIWTFVVVYGAARGMTTLLRATLVGDLFGARNYGAIGGVLAACTTGAVALGPFIGGVLHDALGNYRTVLWVLVGTAVVATLAASRVEPWRRGSLIALDSTGAEAESVVAMAGPGEVQEGPR